MAEIRAFRGIRPAAGKEADIAALPYDVYNREEARKAVEGKPLTFLRIDARRLSFPKRQISMHRRFIRKQKSCSGAW